MRNKDRPEAGEPEDDEAVVDYDEQAKQFDDGFEDHPDPEEISANEEGDGL